MKFLGIPGLQTLINNFKALIHPNTIVVTDLNNTLLDNEGIVRAGETENVSVDMDYDTWFRHRHNIKFICIKNAAGTNIHQYAINFATKTGVLNGFNCNFWQTSEIKENVILRWNSANGTWKLQTRVTNLTQNPKYVVLTGGSMDIDPFFRYYLCISGNQTLNVINPSYFTCETEIIVFNNSSSESSVTFTGQLSGRYPNETSYKIPAMSERVFHIHRYDTTNVLFAGAVSGGSGASILEVSTLPTNPVAGTLYCIPEE